MRIYTAGRRRSLRHSPGAEAVAFGCNLFAGFSRGCLFLCLTAGDLLGGKRERAFGAGLLRQRGRVQIGLKRGKDCKMRAE